MRPLEDLDRVFEYCWGPVAHLMSVKNSDALRDAFMAVQPQVVQVGLRMSQSRPVYQALVSLRDGGAWGISRRCAAADHRVEDQGHGAGRRRARGRGPSAVPADRRAAVGAIDRFSNHVLDATKAFELVIEDPADAEGWTTTLRHMASQSFNDKVKGGTGVPPVDRAGEDSDDGRDARAISSETSTPDAGPWRITLDGPCFLAFMQHSRNRAQREQVYKAFISRATEGELDNAPLIVEMLKLRKEKAALLGYDHHAQVSLATKMAGTVESVQQMFDELTEASRTGMLRDLEELRAFAKEQGEAGELMHWDLGFWAERMREQRFDYTDEELRPYFPLPRVMDGLFGICTKLFGVTFERDDEAAPRWHEDVQFYRVIWRIGRTDRIVLLRPLQPPGGQARRGVGQRLPRPTRCRWAGDQPRHPRHLQRHEPDQG